MSLPKPAGPRGVDAIHSDWRQVEQRQWWLSFSSILVSLLLTAAIVSFVLPAFIPGLQNYYSLDTSLAVQALIGLILIFDLYVIFQQLQLHRFRRQIAQSEELFRLIGENAADMIAVVDAKGGRLYNSPSYQKVLGYSPEELRDTSSFEQIHPDDRQKVMEASREAQQTGGGRRLEYRMRHKDGRWVLLESTASVVRNRAGHFERLVIVNRDITERKRMEAQALIAQKLEAIGKLSGGIAHDFNNILGVIIGYSEELQNRMAPSDANREAIDEIQIAAKRAGVMTQQLLAFSRTQDLAPTILDLNTVVSGAGKMLERLIGEDITLEVVPFQEPCLVRADQGQIERVILNLAVNARDAMPEGGKFTIEIALVDLTEATPTIHTPVQSGPYVMLKVSDTGCGIDAEVRAHIFEPFFTTKEHGTGLGLATVYGIVKQSGGYIWVESEPQKGTTFLFYFPQASVSSQREERPKPTPATFAEERTVLIVDDEKALLKLTWQTMKELGYTVLEAANGFQALEIARQTETPIDLLLTDLVMPGMNGNAVAEILAPLRPNMKIVYMSGYSDVAIADRGLKAGTSILRKPFTRAELIQRVDEVFLVGAQP